MKTQEGIESAVERIVSAYSGMSDRESVNHQIKHWADGVPTHNPIRDECCPDFSCCGSPLMSLQIRQKLLEAHGNGDNETVQNICMMGLSVLINNLPTNVYIAGEDHTEH